MCYTFYTNEKSYSVAALPADILFVWGLPTRLQRGTHELRGARAVARVAVDSIVILMYLANWN